MKRKDKWIEPILWAINGPILTMPGYTDMKPPDDIMANKITMGRMAMVMQKLEKASEAETMWYISTATLCNPLSHSWYEIYMWLFNKVMKDNVPDDLKFDKELDDQQKQSLSRLQEWLYKKSMNHLQSKLKDQEKENYEKANPKLLNFFEEQEGGKSKNESPNRREHTCN